MSLNHLAKILSLAAILFLSGCSTSISTFDQIASAQIIVERPEENGSVNILPCTVTLDDRQSCSLIGGGHAVFTVRSSNVRMRVTSFDPYAPANTNSVAWSSPWKRLPPLRGENIRVVIEPRWKGSTYTGGWHVKTTR